MDKPILLDIPDSITSERLIIRSHRPGDGPEFNAAIRDTLAELQEWLGFYPDGPPTISETEEFVREAHVKFRAREDLLLLLQLKESNRIVGASGLHPRDWKVPSFEIGYWLRAGEWGRGYMTEAVKAITHFAFTTLDAQRVQIRCVHTNVRSAAVALRAGFVFEGRMCNVSRNRHGELRDDFVFSRTQDYHVPITHVPITKETISHRPASIPNTGKGTNGESA